jgi:hypothetical protein
MASLNIPAQREAIAREIAAVINRNSLENGSDTPDFLLADYLIGCLETYNSTLRAREKWYGRPIGGDKPLEQLAPNAIIYRADDPKS